MITDAFAPRTAGEILDYLNELIKTTVADGPNPAAVKRLNELGFTAADIATIQRTAVDSHVRHFTAIKAEIAAMPDLMQLITLGNLMRGLRQLGENGTAWVIDAQDMLTSRGTVQ